MQQIVNTFAQVDFSRLQFPIIVIYNSPSDFRGYYVARIWDMKKPTNTIMIKKKLSQIREDIKNTLPNMVRFERKKFDDKVIVETWI